MEPKRKEQENTKQWPQFIAVLFASLLAIGSGLQIGWPSPSIPKLKEKDFPFALTDEEISYVVSIAPLGYVIGSPLSGYLLDKAGRKNTLLILALPQILGWLFIGASTCVSTLYVARILTGIADGALFTALPIYMCEILEPKVRGVIGTSHSLGIVIGILLINCYGSFMSIRETAYISLSLPLLFLVLFFWMPESPYYFVMKNRINDARRVLKQSRRISDVEDELDNIIIDVKRQLSEPGRLKDIVFIKVNLKAFSIIWGLRTLQQLSGVSAVAFYTQFIFYNVSGGLTPSTSAIICCAIQVLITTFSSVFVDRCGRRPLTILSSVGSAATLIIVGVFFVCQGYGYDVSRISWIPLIGMILYYVVNAIGLLMIPNLMAGELLSASVKCKALGILNIYFGFCTSISTKLFQWLENSFGMHTPFFVFGFCCILGALFCYWCVPETKGKSLEEIQQILKGKVELKDEFERIELNSTT